MKIIYVSYIKVHGHRSLDMFNHTFMNKLIKINYRTKPVVAEVIPNPFEYFMLFGSTMPIIIAYTGFTGSTKYH